MSEPELTFEEWLKEQTEQSKMRLAIIEDRINTLPKHDEFTKALYSWFRDAWLEFNLIYQALNRLYYGLGLLHEELEKHKPPLEFLAKWVEDKKKEEDEKRKYR